MNTNNDPVIVSAVRTPVGKAPRGALREIRPDDLAAAVIRAGVERVPGLELGDLDDIIIGCAFPEGSQGMNMARVASLRAGVPYQVPAMTVNRFCSSGLQTISLAVDRIRLGDADVILAGGAESMSQVPLGGAQYLPNPTLTTDRPEANLQMGLTAELLADQYEISREEQDRFALQSHQRAVAAIEGGRFRDETIPIPVTYTGPDGKGSVTTRTVDFDIDEGPRMDTSIERLARLKPAFKNGGTVTAGNSSQMSDGAAAAVVMSRARAEALGATPIATLKGYAVAGVPPEIMGIGPVEAVPKVLKQTGLSLEDIDLIELNEAFAAQGLSVVKALKLDEAKVNVNGGAIALGHPLGATGAKLTTTLLHEMKRRDARYGMVTMCVGGGMGAAGVFELVR